MSQDKEPKLAHPDDLPDWALDRWPNLNNWPTVRDVDCFVRSTRRQPDVRLAVLTGLRSWEAVDLNPMWGWVASLIALVGIFGALYTSQIPWLRIALGVTLVVMGVIFVTILINVHASADLRRRRARLWLRAFEDAIRH
jgi:hypothetical protein